MEQLPQLKKEILTIREIAERWSSLTGENATEERVVECGLDGRLAFTLRDEVNKNTPSESPLVGIKDFIKHVDFCEAGSVDSDRARQCINDTFVVSMNELLRFEQALLDEQGQQKKSSRALTVNDLFTNLPQRKSELLKMSIQLAKRYIKQKGTLPDAMQIWAMFVEEYDDDYDPTRRTIKSLSGEKGLSDKAFRKKFNEWTK